MKSEKSSIYALMDITTFISYVPQKSKTVILISGVHHSKLEELKSGKPEIIPFLPSD